MAVNGGGLMTLRTVTDEDYSYRMEGLISYFTSLDNGRDDEQSIRHDTDDCYALWGCKGHDDIYRYFSDIGYEDFVIRQIQKLTGGMFSARFTRANNNGGPYD